jgi:hypothetical protein
MFKCSNGKRTIQSFHDPTNLRPLIILYAEYSLSIPSISTNWSQHSSLCRAGSAGTRKATSFLLSSLLTAPIFGIVVIQHAVGREGAFLFAEICPSIMHSLRSLEMTAPERKNTSNNRNLELRETIMVGEMATNSSNSVYKIQRQLFARSERVKGIDFHPVEPWILTTLYSGMLKRIRYLGDC